MKAYEDVRVVLLGKAITASELQVCSLVVAGMSNDDIATTLGNSECTIKVHIRSIMAKLGVYNRVQLSNVYNLYWLSVWTIEDDGTIIYVRSNRQ